MRRTPLLLLLSTGVLGQNDLSNAQQTATCSGTSTFTGAVPLQTVTVTVDGSYTYHRKDNETVPRTPIFYTPPPACASVVVPESLTSTDNGPLSSLGITNALPVSTTVPMNMTTYTSVIIWTDTITGSDTPCSPNFARPSSTANSGPPYANSSMTTITDASTSCGAFLRFGTFTTTQTFISQAPIGGASTAGGGGHPHPLNPGASTPGAPSIPVLTAGNPGTSLTATVTVTKKTPVQGRATTTPPQVEFPSASNNVDTPAAVPAKTTSNKSGATVGVGNPDSGGKTSPSGGNAATPSTIPGGQDKPASNGNSPTGSVAIPPAGTNSPTGGNNNPAGSPDDGTPAASASQGSGIGSIINSAFNSPFTTVGLVTSYGAASATVNLVNGVPVQVEASSVYIGGSYVAIPTGSSTAFVTVNQETFTVVSGAVIGGSSTLAIHRSESISSSPVQAVTLQASTITQNGVVVTIEPTAAIVGGKTYSIGLNAGETRITVNGQAITLNSNGVAFASTTYQPAMITASAYVVTTIGDLIFSIDSSQAIIDGTTYAIGAGALQSLVTTEIDGTTITFGPSGIILPSTTIAPTGVSLTGSGLGSAAASGSATARVLSEPTSSATLSSNSAATALKPPTILSNSLSVIPILLALSTLPLGLLL